MSALSSFFGWFGFGADASAPVNQANSSDQILKELVAAGIVDIDGGVPSRAAMNVAVVNRCIQIITGVCGSSDVNIKDARTLQKLPDHPLRRVLNRKPNRFQTARDFKRLATLHVLLRGNHYSRIVRRNDKAGTVISLNPLNPDRMTLTQNDDLSLAFDYRSPKGGVIRFEQKDIFHMRGLSLDGVRGVSVLTFAQESLRLNRDTHKHARDSISKGNKAGGVIHHEQTLSDTARATLRKSIEAFHSPSSTGSTMVLDEGMKYERIGLSNADLEFLENRKLSVLELLMFFGVPPHMAGLTENSTSWGSGIEQQSIGFINFTLNDWFEMWESAIETQFFPDGRHDADLDDSRLRRGDSESRWKAHSSSLQWGAKTRNEVRLEEGLPPVDGGDQFYDPPNVAGKSINEGNRNEP